MFATDDAEFVSKVGVPIAVALVGLVAAVAVAVFTAAMARSAEATARRREGYAQAVRTLVRWHEYPYRIRRRTSDAPEVLTALADYGHDIQEALRCSETWVTADKGWAGALYHEVRVELSKLVGPSCVEAWNSSPVSLASEMNLSGFGPEGADTQIRRFERAIRYRFGHRCIWSSWVRPRHLRES